MVDDAHDGDDILYVWSQRSHGFTDIESAADREELGRCERLVQFFCLSIFFTRGLITLCSFDWLLLFILFYLFFLRYGRFSRDGLNMSKNKKKEVWRLFAKVLSYWLWHAVRLDAVQLIFFILRHRQLVKRKQKPALTKHI